jgi:hypothetical protein
MSRVSTLSAIVLFCLAVLLARPADAQTTRAEEIDQARRDKLARLWPERESPLVRQANDLVERGFREGVEDGFGANGPQVVLGGMRSGHGMSFGAGYRKTDIWDERIGVRMTGRMTIQDAYMLDGRVDFQGLQAEGSFINLYMKYESSPQMDFYGLGPFSKNDDRSSYLLEDFAADFQAGWTVADNFRFGATGGGIVVKTGRGRRSGVPSATDVWTLPEGPGIGLGTLDFDRWGVFAVYDTRDLPSGTRRGAVYGARFRQYFDRSAFDLFNFRQWEFEMQQFIPYFNETRVIAFRAASTLSWREDDQFVPVFFMPTIGGNDNLRSFARFRYHDLNSVYFNVEHRWYIFRGMDMAVFADAGKVIPRKALVNFSQLEASWGFGFRTRLRDSVVMRTDFAFGRDGARMIWTFSDIFKIDY